MYAGYVALVRGQPETALAAYRGKLNAISNDPTELYNFARLLCDLKADEGAEDVFLRLLPHPDYCFFAAYQLAKRDVTQGSALKDAIERYCTGASEKYKDLIGRLVSSNLDDPQIMTGRRHIAICGVSYSGSTLLDRILNGLPDVASIGESHWLTESYDGVKSGPLDFTNYTSREVPQCSVCGPNCQFLTLNFRAQLAADPSDWYFKIAKQLDAKIVVSADKNLSKFVVNDAQLRFDALVMYKSPKRAWFSELTKLSKGESEQFYLDRMQAYMRVWKSAHAEMVNEFRPRGEKLFVNFDYFGLNPELHLRTICEAFRVAFDPVVLKRTKRGHSIGGNANAMRRLRAGDYTVNIESPSMPDIPPEHAAWIDSQADVTELFREMNERSVRGLWSGVPRSQNAIGLAAEQAAPAAPSTPALSYAKRPHVVTAPIPLTVTQLQPATASQVPPPIEQQPAAVLTPFPIPTIPDERLPGIFEPFETNVRHAAAELGGQPGRDSKRRFYLYLAEHYDSSRYAEIQRRQLVKEHINARFNELKYLDTAFWISGKFDHALSLGLHKVTGLDILDLGCGPGHFHAVCEFFGHRMVGIDIPLRPRVPTAEKHLYDDLCDFFGVRKTPFKIEAGKRVVDLGQRFDLITSFMTWFNSHADGKPWSPQDWTFFLVDVRENLLKPNGKLHLNLVREVLSPESWEFLASRATTVVERNRTVTFEDMTKFSVEPDAMTA